MFRYVVAILLMVALAAPALGTCTWECSQTPFDSDI